MMDFGPGLSVAVQWVPPTMKLFGQADFHNRHQITEAFDRLLGNGNAAIKADLSELQYVDSSGISELIRCAARASEAGGYIELIGVSGQVSRVLNICGAAAFFRSSVSDVPVSYEANSGSPAGSFWRVCTFSIPASPDAAGVARSRLMEVIRSLPLGLAESNDMMVAFGEALANAIKHGCNCSRKMHVAVSCVAGPGRVAIDITDMGKGFDPESVPPPSPQSLVGGGMGIYMMRELVDEVSFSFDSGTTVRLVKYIKHPSKADSEK